MKVLRKCLYLCIASLFISSCSKRYHTSRSCFRKKEKNIPEISAQWKHDKKIYTRISSHYQKYPLFDIFNKKYFDNHRLPQDPIPYNQMKQNVESHVLNELIEYLIQEVRKNKKEYRDFIILQKKNFNRRKSCGLLVLRFKKYPFILKLFMETPKTFINPYCKGIEPITFFFMAGGSNRHIAGLTRIRNREHILQKLKALPKWHVKLPRKWFWTPKKNSWILLKGKNIEDHATLQTSLPGVYAIIADAIEIPENHSLSRKNRNKLIMDLCTDLNFHIDPHDDNYIITTNKNKNYTIYIIDTEHFPSMVGIRDKVTFKSHTSWYLYLAHKCTVDTFLRLKNERTKNIPHNLQLPI